MDRYISTIISEFSRLLGINRQENRVRGLAIRNVSLSCVLRSLGLRLGGGSRMAGLPVTVASRVGAAMASACSTRLEQPTVLHGVPHCWRPARTAWRVSGRVD